MIRKSMPSGHDPRVGIGFPKRSCSNKKIERDDDSKKSHPALTASRGSMALGLPAHRLDSPAPRRYGPARLPAPREPESDDGLHTRPHAPGTLVPGLHSRSAA